MNKTIGKEKERAERKMSFASEASGFGEIQQTFSDSSSLTLRMQNKRDELRKEGEQKTHKS
jgi:hypothetical protein